MQILHGDYDYYYNLATTHEPLVAFVAYSRRVYDGLIARLPHGDTIFGTATSPFRKKCVAASGPRNDCRPPRRSEGVLDCPQSTRR